MPKKITIHAKCLKCDHSLMDYKTEIDGKPSIHVKVKNVKGDEGDLWLCSYYGCMDKKPVLKLMMRKMFKCIAHIAMNY